MARDVLGPSCMCASGEPDLERVRSAAPEAIAFGTPP
jgi:hypothetical protein